MTDFRERAAALDAADPLAVYRQQFVLDADMVAYLDGNSLGRLPLRTRERLASFVRDEWGSRLIRGWSEGWAELPVEVGDEVGALVGAAPGQTVVADSTSICIAKALHAAASIVPGRSRIVVDAGDFPTDRYLASHVAAARGMELVTIARDAEGDLTDSLGAVLDERTAVVLLSHVDYRSGALLELAALTDRVHAAGALVVWDLCHSVGVVPTALDAAGVDLAVGCTYKYLNGGPGSPAFAYLRHGLQGVLRQPIQGWWSAEDIFAMGPEYVPSGDIRQLLSGTPPVTSMLAMQGMLDLIEQSTIAGVRAKSQSLTDLAVRAYDEVLAPLGVRLLSPRDSARRGGHVTIGHPDFRDVTRRLWADGIIPDFRFPDGIRLGLSPLSTSHVETITGVLAVRDALKSDDD